MYKSIYRLIIINILLFPSYSYSSVAEAIIDNCAVSAGYTVTSYVTEANEIPEIHIFGVYETSSNHTTPGTADVYVERRNVSIILVLSSYEPVVWQIHKDEGANISQIILNGYYNQVVEGAEGIPVLNRSGAGNYLVSSAYVWPSTRAQQLTTGIENITGASVSSFNGCYRATSFTIKELVDGNLIDSDNDGVPNQWDQCAETPMYSLTNRNGCVSAELYTKEQVNKLINDILLWGDTDGDNKIGLSEAINALRVTSGTP